jgi:hypothetical protein
MVPEASRKRGSWLREHSLAQLGLVDSAGEVIGPVGTDAGLLWPGMELQ